MLLGWPATREVGDRNNDKKECAASVEVTMGAALTDIAPTPAALATLMQLLENERYLLNASASTSSSAGWSIAVVMRDGADPKDVIRASLHAEILRRHLRDEAPPPTAAAGLLVGTEHLEAVFLAYGELLGLADDFIDELETRGWNTRVHFLEPRVARIHVEN
jgi:hypothetical protein